jgi:hypothetical protein
MIFFLARFFFRSDMLKAAAWGGLAGLGFVAVLVVCSHVGSWFSLVPLASFWGPFALAVFCILSFFILFPGSLGPFFSPNLPQTLRPSRAEYRRRLKAAEAMAQARAEAAEAVARSKAEEAAARSRSECVRYHAQLTAQCDLLTRELRADFDARVAAKVAVGLEALQRRASEYEAECHQYHEVCDRALANSPWVAFDSTPRVLCAFDEGIASLWAPAISCAKKSICIAAFAFGSSRLALALERAAKRGVKVRVLVHHLYSKFTESANFEFRTNFPRVSNMHHKFMICDANAVLTGSANFTWAAVWENNENVLMIRDCPTVSGAFVKEFERLWDAAGSDMSGRNHTPCPGSLRPDGHRGGGHLPPPPSPVALSGPFQGTPGDDFHPDLELGLG